MHRGLNWNVEWATSDRAERISAEIARIDPDVACLTEVPLTVIPGHGHAVTGSDDWGYPHNGCRRKVALWSRSEWTEVDTGDKYRLPGGRFVSAVTSGTRFVGVCIPWRDAHVRSGRRNRSRWEDHTAFLRGLKPALDHYRGRPEPMCLLGDFNQRIPRKWTPVEVHAELLACLGEDLTVCTAGIQTAQGRALIDHIATTAPLIATVDRVIDRNASDGTTLSDHDGVVFNLAKIPT